MTQATALTKEQALGELRRAHDVLLDWLSEYSEEQMQTVQLAGGWTPKDLLAHIARWENICGDYLDQVNAGLPMPQLNATTNELNEAWIAEDRALTVGEVRERADKSYLRVLAMIETLTAEAISETMRGPWKGVDERMPLSKIIAIDTWEHYREHLRDNGR